MNRFVITHVTYFVFKVTHFIRRGDCEWKKVSYSVTQVSALLVAFGLLRPSPLRATFHLSFIHPSVQLKQEWKDECTSLSQARQANGEPIASESAKKSLFLPDSLLLLRE